jgi:hypothetical protein
LTSFIFQATAVGAEFGGERFRGFVEAGVGEKGLLCAGLRYKFLKKESNNLQVYYFLLNFAMSLLLKLRLLAETIY